MNNNEVITSHESGYFTVQIADSHPMTQQIKIMLHCHQAASELKQAGRGELLKHFDRLLGAFDLLFLAQLNKLLIDSKRNDEAKMVEILADAINAYGKLL